MFENITYTRKNKLLAVAAVLGLYLIYALAIKRTLEARAQHGDLQAKMELIENAPAKAQELKVQLSQMNEQIGNIGINGQKTEQALLELLSNYCKNNKAVLRELPQSDFFKQGDMMIETNKFVVEGNFETLLKLVYMLEQKNRLGKVASVRYQYKKDEMTKNLALTATVHIQNIKKQEY